MTHDEDLPAVRAPAAAHDDDDAFADAVAARVRSVRRTRRVVGGGVAALALVVAWSVPAARPAAPTTAQVAAVVASQHDDAPAAADVGDDSDDSDDGDDSDDSGLSGSALLADLDELDTNALVALDDTNDARDDADPSFAWGDLDGSSARELVDVDSALDRALAGRTL